MSVADAVAAVMFAALILYAVFGGADFGSGVWDLTAGNARRGAATRRLIDHAVGPVWEANHVWLIFILVFLWTGFPIAFVTLTSAVAIPLWLAGLGIVARGAGFAFRKYSASLKYARVSGVIFATASLLTPFFLGTIAGATASNDFPTEDSTGMWEAWTGPVPILGGILAVCTCTYLAGVFLCAVADRLSQHELAEQLRIKSLIGGAITGVVVLGGIVVLLTQNRALVDRLLGRGLPLVALSALSGAASMWLLHTQRLRHARTTATVAVIAVVAGWGVAQYPWLILNHISIEDAAGARPTLIGLLIAAGVAAVVVVPPLVYLYLLADSNKVGTVTPTAITPQPDTSTITTQTSQQAQRSTP